MTDWLRDSYLVLAAQPVQAAARPMQGAMPRRNEVALAYPALPPIDVGAGREWRGLVLAALQLPDLPAPPASVAAPRPDAPDARLAHAPRRAAQAQPQVQDHARPEVQAQPQVQNRARPEVQAQPQVQAQLQVLAQPRVEVQPQILAEPYVQAQPQVLAQPQVQAQPQIQAQAPAAPQNRGPGAGVASLREAPPPFAEAYRILLATQTNPTDLASLANQLHFFAALEGPDQPFLLYRPRTPPLPPAKKRYRSREPAASLKDAVCHFLQAKKEQFFILALAGDRRVRMQIHGEHNPNIGRALHHFSGEFRAALELALDRDRATGSTQVLEGLFDAIKNWCFDGSMNKLNQYLQETDLAGGELSLVPDLVGKKTPQRIAAEFARVFALHQARRFFEDTGRASLAADGTQDPDFLACYLNGGAFFAYLRSHASASTLTSAERLEMRRCVVEDLMLFD